MPNAQRSTSCVHHLVVVTACLLQGCFPSRNPPPSAPRTAPQQAHFAEAAQSAGLHYVWTIAGDRPLNILQTIGNGCAFLDYDNDGNLDILLVGTKPALFQGDGKGKFADVTQAVGLNKLTGHFLGCAVGDYDNDGADDVYLSGYRTGILLHNEAAGTGRVFRDVTAQAGLKPQPWGTSCAWAETRPGSGKLDLYVANYARFDPATDQQLCKENGVMTSCGPRTYTPIQGVLYLNDGSGRFHDATTATGLHTATGRGLGVGFMDYDGSGKPGIAIANDEIPGDLFQPTEPQSKQQIAYLNAGLSSGTAFDGDGNTHGGMGLDWGDFDNDGKPDLAVMTYQNEVKCLYRNDGDGSFKEIGQVSGWASATPTVAFGCKFLDYDNDGLLDMAIVNGHVMDNVQQVRPTTTYRQPTILLHNRGAEMPRFEDVSSAVGGAGFAKPIVGRGMASGDYDNDGKVDVLIVDSEGSPLLLHNETPQTSGHFFGMKLIGKKSNRNGYGAVVTVTLSDGRKLVRVCHADGSYLSSSDSRVHFGLGKVPTVDSLQVTWLDGHTDSYSNIAADRYITLREGDQTIP